MYAMKVIPCMMEYVTLEIVIHQAPKSDLKMVPANVQLAMHLQTALIVIMVLLNIVQKTQESVKVSDSK